MCFSLITPCLITNGCWAVSLACSESQSKRRKEESIYFQPGGLYWNHKDMLPKSIGWQFNFFLYFMENSYSIWGIFSLSYFKLFHQLQKLWHHDKYYYTEVRVNLWICILYCYLFDHKTRSIIRYIQRNISLKILRKYCSWVRGFSPKSSIC